MHNNNNTSIANKLEIVFHNISVLDEMNINEAIALIQKAHNVVEVIAQENEAPILRAIVHWMALNTEINIDNQQQIETLVENHSYYNWIDILANLLNKSDFTLLPTLHQSLTSPNWIVRPSALLLKGIATWLAEIKMDIEHYPEQQPQLQAQQETAETAETDENILIHQVSNQTQDDVELIDSEQASGSIDEFIIDQIAKAEEANEDTLAHQTIFQEIKIDDLEKEYASSGILTEFSAKEQTSTDSQIPLMETEKSSIDDEDFEKSKLVGTNLDLDLIGDDLIEIDLTPDDFGKSAENNQNDFDLLIDENLLAENETLVETLINPVKTRNTDEDRLNDVSTNIIAEDKQLTDTNIENDLLDIYQSLMSASTASSNVFSAKGNYTKQLDRLVVLTESSTLEAVTAITEWCQNNLVLFEANPTDSIKTFISSGLVWSWINKLHDCLNNSDKNTCLNDLTDALTYEEWLEPVDTHELKCLLISLKSINKSKGDETVPKTETTNHSELENNLLNESSSELFDMPQLIDNALVDIYKENELEKNETSGLQITWDNDTLPELLMVYLEETPIQIKELVPLLNKISHDKADEEEKNVAIRLAHTIKSGSAIVGITALSEFTFRIEKLLDHSKKHKIDDKILKSLPNVGNCLQSIFDAVQLQLEEPAEFLSMFNTLDNYASNLDSDDDDLLEIASAPVLPDLIINQNNDSENALVEEEISAEIQHSHEEVPNELKQIAESNVDEKPAEENNEKSGFQLNWNDDTHPELLMVYLEETPSQINELVPLMNKISEGTANREEKHTASRMAHTIKGGSAIVGITALSEISYRLESLLDHSIKYQLPAEILTLLPKAALCLEGLFEAVQMQDDEPDDFYSIFQQLDSYVETMKDGIQESDEPLELITPVLPDFIINQNISDKENLDETAAKYIEEPLDEHSVTQNNKDAPDEIIESVSIEAAKLEKLKSTEDVNNIVEEIDDIVMHLITTSTNSNNIKADLEQYSVELQRFDLLTEISGYPELSLLSRWCQSNLTLFAKSKDKKVTEFINSGEIWSWIEFVGVALNEPDDMSHLSSLSVELMRDDWAQAIEMDDLQTVLLALRHLEEKNISIDPEYIAEDVNSDEVISWDKDIHPELLAVYFKETPDQIYEVAALLHKIAKGESSTEENKKAARIAHTIKGASGVVGLNSLLELTHSLEDILDYSVNNKISNETAELLAEASDCMESLFESIQNKKVAPEELKSVLERLSAFSKSLGENNPTLNSVIKSEVIETVEDEQKLSIKTIATKSTTDSDDIQPIEQIPKSKVDINEAHIRVPVRIIDKLLNLAGELVTTSNQVSDGLAKSLATNKVIKTQDIRVNNMLEELSNTISEQEKDQHKLLSSLGNSNFDSLEMDTYNELHSVASLLSESFLDSQEIDNTLNKQLNELSDKLRSLDKLNKDFSDVILSSRMVSINTIIPRLERIVRQTCRKTNKKAQLIVTGNEINIDTDILNGLIDPLLHMLRNSIDHGIEDPEERIKADKDETGLIELSFTRDGNNILMALKDDGAGINPETIYQKAIEKALITPNQEFSKRETLKLILQPGFSTQENVTDISGRGVGMDVVNSSVEALNGTLAIDSDMGHGTTFNLSIPLTLITNTTLLVKAANNTVAIPIDTIEQIIHQETNNVIARDDNYFVLYEDQELQIKSLGQLLSWSNQTNDFSTSSNVLIIKTGKKKHAIHVDSILSSREVVVKPLSPWISPVKGVIGACHLNDGGVAPVINLLTVVKQAKNDSQSDSIDNGSHANTISESRATPQILVVDDSLSNRKALSLVIDKTEYDVVTAVDGLDALQIMNEKQIDLVFTDLEMPRMNGIELTQAIRAWSSKSKTPIVMITSRTTNKHRELATKAGVDDYLTKPVVTETLLESINTWLVEMQLIQA